MYEMTHNDSFIGQMDHSDFLGVIRTSGVAHNYWLIGHFWGGS